MSDSSLAEEEIEEVIDLPMEADNYSEDSVASTNEQEEIMQDIVHVFKGHAHCKKQLLM